MLEEAERSLAGSRKTRILEKQRERKVIRRKEVF
jgi:hypothetical protein